MTLVDPHDVEILTQLARAEQRRGPSHAAASQGWVDRGLAAIDAKADAASPNARHDLLQLAAINAEMQAPPESPPANKQRTAHAARAWFFEARARGLPTGHAIAMCRNAGAPDAFCDGRSETLP